MTPPIKRRLLIVLGLCLILITSSSTFAMDGPAAVLPDTLTYKPLRFKPPQAKRITLDNGLILYILEDHELPLVNISAVFRAGSARDPVDKAGLAELTFSVMRTGGAGTMNGDDLDDLLAFRGISIGFSADMDMGTAHLSVLRQDIEQGIDIFAQMLRRPLFSENKLQLARDLYVEDLRSIADDPPKYAFREFRKLLYQGNPRGNLPTQASLKAIQRSDLIAFHKRYIHPGNILLAVSGDITTDEARNLIQRHLGDWQKAGSPEALPVPQGERDVAIHYLHKDTPQSVVIIGQLAPSKRDGNFYAFSILDFLLGSGGFRSRIFQEIRTERGLAYSAGSSYRARSDYGAFSAYAMTKASSTTEVLSLIRMIVNRAKGEDFSHRDISWAKKSMINSFIFSFQSSDQIASQQMRLEYDRLPGDFLLTYPERIDKVLHEDLRRTAKTYLSQDRAVTLVLGNEKAFDRPLSSQGTVKTIEGAL